MGQQESGIGGVLQGAAGAASMLLAGGGEANPTSAPPVSNPGAKSFLGQYLQAGGPVGDMGIRDYAKGGRVDALVSPGEKWLSPSAVEQVKEGGDPMKVGETIPGRPKVGGAKNSYDNDVVSKQLEEGGIVVPRSETKSKNPSRDSKAFVAATLAKKRAKR
jgi:hypothetical protein